MRGQGYAPQEQEQVTDWADHTKEDPIAGSGLYDNQMELLTSIFMLLASTEVASDGVKAQAQSDALSEPNLEAGSESFS